MDATSIELTDATSPADAEIVAALAARTFGDACPPWLSRQYVQEFIDNELSAARFALWIADPDAHVVLASVDGDGDVHGYALCIHDAPKTQRNRVCIAPSAMQARFRCESCSIRARLILAAGQLRRVMLWSSGADPCPSAQ
ncbi:MAG: hypothetical protein ACK5MR_18890 [Cumulibacter sp.]